MHILKIMYVASIWFHDFKFSNNIVYNFIDLLAYIDLRYYLLLLYVHLDGSLIIDRPLVKQGIIFWVPGVTDWQPQVFDYKWHLLSVSSVFYF